jgi:acyl transferase domain-containing protein
MSRGRSRDIAIVGMACRFPGAADLFEFWANVRANRDCTTEVPADRWPVDLFYAPDSKANDRVACRRGGYLHTPIRFDAAAHGIMPIAVEGGEPEQFLVLEAARNALVDARIDLDRVDRDRVEVVIGRGNYFNRGNLTRLQHGRIVAQTVGLLAAVHPEWSPADLDAIRHDLKSSLPPFEAATIPGQLTNATAGRVSDRLDLTGAGFVVDAASASSLVALDLGGRALREGRADLALVGGVYLEADVDFPLVFRQLDALSRSGVSRPFSNDADGAIPGEGVGVVVLKRLRDAERDGDRIYAVVKGVGLASDGKGRGLAAPSARGHARAIRRAYRTASVDPSTVELIEGHGLGSPASDRAEVRALGAIFAKEDPRHRILGSVASQIGHAMPAAGMAGLIKTALSLHHRVLPPTRNAENPLPLLADVGFELLNSERPWIHADPDTPRRAGVNAFGFAGINAHAVLEEHAGSADGLAPGAILDWDCEAILLAAESRGALAERVHWLRDRLAMNSGHKFKDLAFTLNTDFDALAHRVRLGLTAGSLTELSAHLDAVETRLRDPNCRQIKDARGIYFWDEPLGRDGNLAFLFPGEGSQYPGMLADLCPHFPELRAVFDNADQIARESGDPVPPSCHLFAASATGSDALWETDTAVTTVLSAQWALFQVLTRLGLKPSAVAGHSSGELLALTAAGAIRMERSLERQLGRLSAIFRDLEASGTIPEARLVAIGADRRRVEAVCQESGDSVVVAIDNCPHQVVVAGPRDDVERVVAAMRGRGVVCEDLPFARAYHTPDFASVVQPLDEFYAGLEFHTPEVLIYSCASARPMPASAKEMRGLAVAQWTLPVSFRETIETMHRDGLRLFVDVGARGNLCGYVEDTLRGSPAFAVAANLPRRSGTAQLNHLVASLFAQGVAVDASYLYARRRPVRIDLDAATPPPAATVPVHIGFPEMKLSESVIARFQERARHVKTRPEAHVVHTLNGNGHEAAANGNGYHHEASPPAQADTNPMLDFYASMNEFLNVQRDVVRSYLGGMSGGDSATSLLAEGEEFVQQTSDEPGPWVGEIFDWSRGESIVTRFALDPTDDPVAENHTIGGRRVSALDPNLRGLPVVPFSVMAEMVAQVGALVVEPGLVLEGLEGVHAHKWVQYRETHLLELRGERTPQDPFKVRVTLHELQADGSEDPRLVYEGVACFTDQRPEPVEPGPFELNEPEECVFTADRLYDEQWLFHGPIMQALVEIGPISLGGVSGAIEVLPLAELLKPGAAAAFHTDPIVVDTFTHLLGCWGLDRFEEGDVVFPLGMGRLSIFGDGPPAGTPITCRIKVRGVERHRILVDADLVRPDGRLWMTIEDWADWRFYWPGRYRDVFRAPDLVFIGEELPLPGISPGAACAVWLAPPADMARPVWREVLEQTQLAPMERAAGLAMDEPDRQRTHRIWGRVAAKEAVRRLWLADGGPPRYPADLTIEPDRNGKLRLRDLAEPDLHDVPAIAIAHDGGAAFALAARDPSRLPGVGIQSIEDRADGFDESSLTAGERSLLSQRLLETRREWIARIGCAKQAAARAIGLEVGGRPAYCEVVSIDDESGEVSVAPVGLPAMAGREPSALAMRVRTGRKDDYAWAWTLGEKVRSS